MEGTLKKCTETLLFVGMVLLMAACPSPEIHEFGVVRFAIAITPCTNGTVSTDRDSAEAGEVITLTVLPDKGHKLDLLRVTGMAGIVLGGSGNIRSFIMPAADVTVTAVFSLGVQAPPEEPGLPGEPKDPDDPDDTDDPDEPDDPEYPYDPEIPAYAIAIPDLGERAIMSVSAPHEIPHGKTVTLTLIILDDDYRYRQGSIGIAGMDSGTPVEFTLIGEMQWTFIMPAEAVAVDAALEPIPYYRICIADGVENGRLVIAGTATGGNNAGKAREGAAITVTAIPDFGYKTTDELAVMPLNAVAAVRLNDRPVWTFIMPDNDLEIRIDFAGLGLRDIYRGGARSGITIGELLDDDKKYYENSIELESATPGRNHSGHSLKITHALNANGNAVQQSFGLFSDTEIDLDTITALSFWAKANKPLNIRYVGFGDADSARRVVYTGEGFNQQIPVTAEWTRYIVPVPAFGSGITITRVFMLNILLQIGNYLLIDDIELLQSGVSVTGITIPETDKRFFYGPTGAHKILKGVPLQLNYAYSDGTTITLQSRDNNHTLKHDLSSWLAPFVRINGNVRFADGVITANDTISVITLTVDMGGVSSDPMTSTVIDGLLLDDFEDTGSITIQANPVSARGYLWHTGASGSVVTRGDGTVANKEIFSGLGAGSWRPGATANNPRGGRNFEAHNADAYDTLTFRIKVTTGGNDIIQKNTVFTFELRNSGTLGSKSDGVFYKRQFTYNPDSHNGSFVDDGWQKVIMKLADFADAGLDTSAITGYAFGVVDNQGAALRIMLDDIAIIR